MNVIHAIVSMYYYSIIVDVVLLDLRDSEVVSVI